MNGAERFLGRADDYSLARPSYPSPLLPMLREKHSIEAGSRIADVGSGTGILSRLLLRSGATVYGVEPNPEMRAIAEKDLAEEPSFVSLDGTAEDLPFDDAVLDMIACGQSFHWFDPDKAREEFSRTLHGLGLVMLLWNTLDDSDEGVSEAVQAILREAEGGKVRGLMKESLELRKWYASGTYQSSVMKHTHVLQLDQVIPYARSRSYWPDHSSDEGIDLEKRLMEAVAPYASKDQVALKVSCEIHIGQLG